MKGPFLKELLLKDPLLRTPFKGPSLQDLLLKDALVGADPYYERLISKPFTKVGGDI